MAIYIHQSINYHSRDKLLKSNVESVVIINHLLLHWFTDHPVTLPVRRGGGRVGMTPKGFLNITLLRMNQNQQKRQSSIKKTNM